MILNSRSLSYVSSGDMDEPLTPSHLLKGRRLLSLPDHSITGDLSDPDFELSSTDPKKTAKHLCNVMNHFWRRWKNEYLMELHDSHRRSAKSTKPTPIAVGDIVVVHDEERPRGFWRLARVEYRNRRSGSRCIHEIKVGKTEMSNSTVVPVGDKKWEWAYCRRQSWKSYSRKCRWGSSTPNTLKEKP